MLRGAPASGATFALNRRLNERLNKPAPVATAAGGEVTGSADLKVTFAYQPAGMRTGLKTSGGLFRTVQLDRGRAMEKNDVA